MRIISIKTLKDFWRSHPDAEKPLRQWFRVVEAARWRDFVETRGTFGGADVAKVHSGNTITIFDIGGNKYRLLAAIHYNTEVVYALMVLTHAQYDSQKWKRLL